MTRYGSRVAGTLRLADLLRSHLYLVRMFAVGLIAIGVSGAVCQVIGWRLGDHALAADSESAHLSAARCADLLEYYPSKTCAAAEMAHHADEVVEYRLAVGMLGIVGLAGYAILRRRAALLPSEQREQSRRYLIVGVGAFGLAAAALLGIGAGVLLAAGDAAPRWLADGGVAAAFFAAHAALLRPALARPS